MADDRKCPSPYRGNVESKNPPYVHSGHLGELRALDRLPDQQIAAVELMVYYGLPAGRVAKQLQVEEATVRRWLRESRFHAACIELTRAFAAGQLVPLALFQCRRLLMQPDLKPKDAVSIARLAAELAGAWSNRETLPFGGAYAPQLQQRSLDSMSAAELEAASDRAEAALAQLDSALDSANPLD